jgi:SAM-dependent methyltransferase
MQKLSETELQEMASQLRCPNGEVGMRTADLMNTSNANMIERTVRNLSPEGGDIILEIGPGNAFHVKDIFKTYNPQRYVGIDISATMVEEAQKLNRSIENVSFQLIDGIPIPFDTGSFTKIFTVNTIYFWNNPQSYCNELFRLLESGGRLCIGYIPKRVMQNIPFAKYGFMLWEESEVAGLLRAFGFEIVPT